MITVNITDKEPVIVSGLIQWDYGQKLQIAGLNLPETVEIHFSLTENCGNRVPSIGRTVDGITEVDIPDFILQNESEDACHFSNSYYAYAFVYVADGETGTTERKITLDIERSPKPTTNVPEDQKDKFLQEVRQVMAESKEVADSVRTDADNGKFNGPQGLPGKDGKDGEDGQDGKDGKSAYQYAVEGGFKGTEQEFIDLMAQAGHVDLTGYVTKEQHEAELLKAFVKVTTEKAPYHHITDSANMKVVDFGMEGITEQYTGTITDDEGNEVTVLNPNNPQEIKLAGVYNEETGRYEHKCCVGNKNWCKDVLTSTYVQSEGIEPSTTRTFAHNTYRKGFVSDGTHNEATLDVNFLSDRVEVEYAYFGYGLGFPMQLPKGKTVTASLVGATSDNFTFYWAFYDNDGKHIGQENGKSVVLIPNNCEWTVVIVSGNPNDGWVSFNAIQVELDFVETDYTPHASQQFTLTSDRPLTMWDKLVKRDGVWGWSVNNLKTLLKGISDNPNLYYTWNFYGEIKGYYVYSSLIVNKAIGYQTSICRQFKNVDRAYEGTGLWNYTDHATNSVIYVCTDIPTIEEFRTYLSENPVELTYKTKTEQAFIPLPEEEQTLLNNLETYYGVTNVYNEQGCPMWFKYCADQELHWNQKLLQIQQAII